MCVYTGKCGDLVELKYKLTEKRKDLRVAHKKISLAVDGILEDMINFMDSAINHMEKLYGKESTSAEEAEFYIWYKKNEAAFANKIDIARAAYFRNKIM